MTPTAQVDGARAFSDAAQRVVDFLNTHTPITDWSVTRVDHGVQVHVHVHHEDVLEKGDRVDWSDSLCRRMVGGAANVVPDAGLDPDYADLEVTEQVKSYTGFPITDEDGSMFGVLCGAGTTPLDSADDVDADLVRVMSELLSTNLRLARTADRERHEARLALAVSQTDALTGLINRRGWDDLVDEAEERVQAYGDPVGIAVIDLDGLKRINDTEGHRAGDELLKRAGEALAGAATERDRVARFGGDEFVVLTEDVGADELQGHYERFVRALADAGIAASLGFAESGPEEPLRTTFDRADALMYESKMINRQGAGRRHDDRVPERG